MLLRVAVLTSLLAGSAWAQGNAPPSAPPDPSQSVGGVYNELAPHGRWLYSSDYGWVWTPNQQVVGNDFVPYASNGHWVYSDAGWMFESGYPWGWLAFHYGRWDYGQFGWIWIPGFVWGPAWVDWRYGNGYVGWAPLLPRLRARRMHHWFFVRANHFTHRRVRRYFVGRHATRRLLTVAPPIRAMVVRGNHRWYHGPAAAAINRYRNRPLVTVRVQAPRRGVVANVRVRGNRTVLVPRYRRPVPGTRYRRPVPGTRYRRSVPGTRYRRPVPGTRYRQPVPGTRYRRPVPGTRYRRPAPGTYYRRQPAQPSRRARPADRRRSRQPARRAPSRRGGARRGR